MLNISTVWESPYSAFGNNPIYYNDPRGADFLDKEDSPLEEGSGWLSKAWRTVSNVASSIASGIADIASDIGSSFSKLGKYYKNNIGLALAQNTGLSSGSTCSGCSNINCNDHPVQPGATIQQYEPNFSQRMVESWENNLATEGTSTYKDRSQLWHDMLDGANVAVGNFFNFVGLTDLPAMHINGRIANDNEIRNTSVGFLPNLLGAVGGAAQAMRVTTAVESGTNTLFHYTSESSYNAIIESKELFPSIGVKNARHGPGQYLTDIAPADFTIGQTSRRLFGVPWNKAKLTHYLEIDVGGLNVVKNAPYNYVIPGTESLPLGGRIINGGKSVFKQ